MVVPVDLLPKEVLHDIFLYLTVSDKLNAALVCKRWLDVMNSKSLLRDTKVLINDNNTVPLFVKSSRNFLNFKFHMIIIDNKYYKLFERISSVVEYLSFERCEIWKREPVKFDLTYENLKVLESFDCNLWSLFPSVPNLTEFYLRGNSTITDDGIAIMQKTMKRLRILKLDCYIAFDRVVYKRFYCHGDSYETSPSSSILSFPAIMSFISEKAITLKELKFPISLTAKALLEISKIKNLSLYKVELPCYECSKSVLDLVKSQPNLKKLILYGASAMNDQFISDICILLPDIEELHVDGCDITSHSLNKVLNLKKLEKLRLSGNNCKSEGNLEILKDVESHPLRSLDIQKTEFQCIDSLIELCSNLVYLDLSGCDIKDCIVHLLSTNLTKLEHLYLKSTRITDYALTGIRPAEENEDEAEGSNGNISPVPLSNLKRLKSLYLNESRKITKFGLKEGIHFQNLEYLNILGCDVDESTVEALIQQNPMIRKIFCDDSLKTNSFKSSKVVKVKSKSFHSDFLDTVFNEDNHYYFYDGEMHLS